MLRQREPLRVPKEWTGEKRSFVMAVERALDGLYKLFGRITKSDLDKTLQDELDDSVRYSAQTKTADQKTQARANIDAMFAKCTRLGTGVDINNITTPGFYEISTGVTNGPPMNWCALIVVKNGGTYQIAYKRERIYVRDYTGDPPAWSDWAYISPYGGTLANGANLNTVVTPAFYLLPSSYTYTNRPTGADALLVLRSGVSANAILQICFGQGQQRMWFRFRTDATNWAPWINFCETEYRNGVNVTITTGCGYGFVTSSTKLLRLSLPLYKNIPAGAITITSFKACIRGISGYVDIFTDVNKNTEKIGTSGYTFRSSGVNGQLYIEIEKSSEFTNITNNTPVALQIINLAFSIAAA